MPEVPEDCEMITVAVMEQEEKDEGKLEMRPKMQMEPWPVWLS